MRGVTNGGPQVVSARRMESIFRHEDVAYAAECKITSQKTPNSNKPQ